MKIRTNFVSNSSSSSFVLDKMKLTLVQYGMLKNIKEAVEKIALEDKIDTYNRFGDVKCISDWDFTDNDEFFSGSTYMNNFDMIEFINYIGANRAINKCDNECVWFDESKEFNLTEEEWLEATEEILRESGIEIKELNIDDEIKNNRKPKKAAKKATKKVGKKKKK